jgi:hypothetical protein
MGAAPGWAPEHHPASFFIHPIQEIDMSEVNSVGNTSSPYTFSTVKIDGITTPTFTPNAFPTFGSTETKKPGFFQTLSSHIGNFFSGEAFGKQVGDFLGGLVGNAFKALTSFFKF